MNDSDHPLIPDGLAETPTFEPRVMNVPKLSKLPTGSTSGGKPQQWRLNTPLFEFAPGVPFTIRDACSGLMIFGESGSGKSSSLTTPFLYYLKAGFGAVVMCVKAEEAPAWVQYAATVGRSNDVIRITADADCPYRFDFLAHELNQPDSSTLSVVAMIQDITSVLRQSKSGGSSNDAFWVSSSNTLLKNTIDLYKLANVHGRKLVQQGELPADTWLPPYQPTILTVLKLITSAANRRGDFDDKEARKKSLNLQYLELAAKVASWHKEHPSKAGEDLIRLFQLTLDFWKLEWAKDEEGDTKLKDNITAFARTTLDALERGPVANLFQRVRRVNPETQQEEWVDTVTPEMVDDGKIILVDLPIQQWQDSGRLAACIWKYCIQRHLERRADRTRAALETVERRTQKVSDQAYRQYAAALPTSRVGRLTLPWLAKAAWVSPTAAKKHRAIVAAQRAYARAKIAHDAEVDAVTNSVRIVVIACDEYQEVAIRRDAEFQATARSTRCAMVAATQTTASIGEKISEEAWQTFVGNLTTTIIFRVGHSGTREYASKLIGSDYKVKKTKGKNFRGILSPLWSPSVSESEELQEKVKSIEFTQLKKGGEENGFIVEAWVVLSSAVNGKTNAIKVTFNQKIGQKSLPIPKQFMAEAKAELDNRGY